MRYRHPENSRFKSDSFCSGFGDAIADAMIAFSERVTEEIVLPGGEVKKTSTFKHKGFVEITK